MNGLSKLAKFFIICAAVFFVGLVCTIIGVATGGPQDIEKLADRYDWIQGGPGERCVMAQKVTDFHSIEATGDADLWIVGKDFYKKASWLADQDLLEQTELAEIEPGKVIVISGDQVDPPEISVSNGVLTINSGTTDFSGISLNTTNATWYPQIMVCVPNEVLQSLKVSGQACDVHVLGAAWDAANIGLNSGDISMEGVKSGGLTVNVDSGDVDLDGKFMGVTTAGTESGDIDINTSLAKAEYALQINTDAGDIKVDEGTGDPVEYEDGQGVSAAGGPHKIIAKAQSGDISIQFAGE